MRACLSGPRQKEPDSLRRLQLHRVGIGSRQGEGRHGIVDFAGDAQGFAAGGEDADARTGRQEDACKVRAGRTEMFTVVEDEEQLGVTQPRREMFVERLVRRLADVEGRGRLAGHEGRIRQGSEVDQEDSVRRARQRSCGGLQRDPRFADAADPGQHQQAHLIEQPIDVGELGLAADEARDRRRKVVPLLRGRGGFDFVSQDRPFERLQLLARLEAKLIGEQRARALVGREGIRLTLGAVQRQHQLSPEPLAIRVDGDEGFELVDELRGTTECKVCIDPLPPIPITGSPRADPPHRATSLRLPDRRTVPRARGRVLCAGVRRLGASPRGQAHRGLRSRAARSGGRPLRPPARQAHSPLD